ncbi:uncharacterized protein DC041_0000619 [Schistosoma bovis]|uniref:G-protein coupled receptors family 2 profile 2 domain-containing protein n=1 Tax=Schistosoma bovis TaxID=6184 RepID=A0A430QI52_SCHBO|nr:uncharacterized protein DC041_0000619 [Schistosoma bovis]
MAIDKPDSSNFIGFPRSVSEIIYDCFDYHHKPGNNNFTKLENNMTNSIHEDSVMFHGDTIEITYLNETYLRSINSYCPILRSQSTVAHISMAVASITMFAHFIMVFSVNKSLRRLYGNCLSLIILFNSIHNGVLFFSAYMPSTISFNMTNKEVTYFTRENMFFNCRFMDFLTHYLILSIYLGIFFGLFEHHLQLNHCYKHSSIKTKSWNFKSPHCLWKKQKCPSTSCQKTKYNDWFNNSCAITGVPKGNFVKKFQCVITQPEAKFKTVRSLERIKKDQERKTRFVALKDGYSSHQSNIIPRVINNDVRMHNNRMRNFIVISAIVCLPIFPTTYGIWASYYLNLNSIWNPAYGIITCGNLGGCLTAYQWLMHIPVAFLCFASIVLIILISIKTDTNCLIQAHFSSQSVDVKARFRMFSKMAISHTFLWILAFISNYICHTIVWQFYGIFIALQSLYIIVSFTFSRPFLEVLFKRDDPLGRLKLDNLAMQLPLGVFHSHRSIPMSSNVGSSVISPLSK